MKIGFLIITFIVLFKFEMIKVKSQNKLKEKGDIPKFCSKSYEAEMLQISQRNNDGDRNKPKERPKPISKPKSPQIHYNKSNYGNTTDENELDNLNNLTYIWNTTYNLYHNSKNPKNIIPVIINNVIYDQYGNIIGYTDAKLKYDFLSKIFGIYLLFFILNWLKWLEEIDKSKKEQINTRYTHFEDLSQIISLNTDKYEGKFVFINGIIFSEFCANDKIFNFDYGKTFMKIERVVEIFDVVRNKWISSQQVTSDHINALEILLEKKDKLESLLKLLQDETSVGRGSLKGIKVSSQYFKKIETFEKIKWTSLQNLTEFNKILSDFEGIDMKIENEYYLVLSFNSVRDNKNMQIIRITLLGFRGEFLSILAKLKGKAFRTIMLPLDNETSQDLNKTEDLNNPPEMEVVLEVSLNPFNLLCCCCLNDPPYYKPLEDGKYEDPSQHINWVSDKLMNKQEFLYEKHNIIQRRLNTYRFVFCSMIFTILFFFPYPVYLLYTQLCYEITMVKDFIIIFNLLMSCFIVYAVIFYTSLTWTNKGLVNIFLMGLFSFWLILSALKIVLQLF